MFDIEYAKTNFKFSFNCDSFPINLDTCIDSQTLTLKNAWTNQSDLMM